MYGLDGLEIQWKYQFKFFACAGLLVVEVFMHCEIKKNDDGYIMQEGDFLFQEGDCGPFCEAIKKVTFGVDGLGFSHIGLVKKNLSGDWVVLEAISDGVVETPLNAFLERGLDNEGKPKVAAGRLTEKYRNLIPNALSHARKYMGKPYDHEFDISNDAYYCSKLIYFIFKEANLGEDVFFLEPMTFIDPDSGKTFPAWGKYFRDLGAEIPENKPGLNPGSISRSDKIEIFYPYSQFKAVIRRAG